MATSVAVRRRVRVRRFHGAPDATQFGLSLKPSKKLKAAVKKVGKTVGKALDSKIVKGAVAGTLALTGVGAGASAAIMATQGAAAKAAQGKRLKTIAKGAAIGGATGAAAGMAGKVLPKIPKVGSAVTRLRQKIGTAPKPAVSYDAQSKIDALTSQPLPDVSVLPSTAAVEPPALKPITRKPPIIRHKGKVVRTPDLAPPTAPTVGKTVADLAKRRAAEEAKKRADEAAKMEREAREARAQAQKEKQPSKRSDLLKKAARLTKEALGKKARAAAGQQVAELVGIEPHPAGPQGGFPATPQPAFPEPETREQQEASASGGMNPMVMLAIGIGAVALMMRK